jgi:hypothetical protein
MRYMNLRETERDALLLSLRDMPSWLEGVVAGLSREEETRRGAGNTFAPVEQCWHLAELERDAFALRLQRLRDEEKPVLPDFDGERAAIDGNYLARTCADGVAAFAAARRANLHLIASIRPEEWTRAGSQAGVGDVSLCDLPAMMAEHDASHRSEIEAWLAARAQPTGGGADGR